MSLAVIGALQITALGFVAPNPGSHLPVVHFTRSLSLRKAAETPPMVCKAKCLAMDEAGACALLVGTAIGGGFLALPHATAPAGCAPSGTLLIACWAVLLFEALLVADIVINRSVAPSSAAADRGTAVSFATLGRDAFGIVGGRAVSATFVVLMCATLVSQLAKASSLLAPALNVPFGAVCVPLAASLAIMGRAMPARSFGAVTGGLTAGFIAATCALFGQALPQAVWTRLARSDWNMCLQSAPTLLQLHVYIEIVPTICEVLRFERKRVRRTIVLGSLMLLLVQLSWSTLGLALVPFSGGALRADPVDALLRGAAGGGLAASAYTCAATAILTTILGTARALSLFCSDAFRARGAQPHELRGPLPGWYAYAAFIGAPALIACRASASDAFFGAIDLAGAYPVALLWGLACAAALSNDPTSPTCCPQNAHLTPSLCPGCCAGSPPLMAMRLRSSHESGSRTRLCLWPRAGLLGLAAIALTFVGCNLFADVSALIGRGVARWR
jgi:tyrosine-specific transport protein